MIYVVGSSTGARHYVRTHRINLTAGNVRFVTNIKHTHGLQITPDDEVHYTSDCPAPLHAHIETRRQHKD